MLRDNEELVTLDGEVVEVLSPVGEGGHVEIYHVKYQGKNYILKWNENGDYRIGNASFYLITKFISNLLSLDKYVVLPKAIVIHKGHGANGDEFGYLMESIPEGFLCLYDYFRVDRDPKAWRFSSYMSQLNAAGNLVYFIRCLHMRGLCFIWDPSDLFFHPDTGEMKVVNCENVYIDGEGCKELGIRMYMAPEIPRSNYKHNPSIKTDRYSLAVVLYRLFFFDHPMEGKKWEQILLFTEKVEDYLYAIKPVFHFNPEDITNRPTDIYAPTANERWNTESLFSKELRDTFISVFTEGIDNPEKRPSEIEWLSVIAKTRDKLIRINPTREQFVDFNNRKSIPNGCLTMKIGSNYIPLYPLKTIYGFTITGDTKQFAKVDGGIVYDKRIDKLALRNLTDQIWRCYSPNKKQLTDLCKGQEFPLEPGVAIEFYGENPKIIGEIYDPLQSTAKS